MEAEFAQTTSSGEIVAEVKDLVKHYPLSAGLFRKARHFVHAVDGVSFQVRRGEMFGLVGESGCGKTTTGRLLTRLEKPTAGSIRIEGMDVPALQPEGLRAFRRRVQMIFQDPYQSLNPRMTVYDAVAEPLAVHGIGRLQDREEQVARMLMHVGITPPDAFMFRFPHELSGGQRQRVAIARALVLEPSFIVADEPTSMLDVSIRTGVMKLLDRLRREFQMSFLYITHDLAVARYLCEGIAVMYLGKVVEQGPTEDVIQNPLHPYTRALMAAVPEPDPDYRRPRVDVKGGVSRPIDPEPRCRFYDRCPIATERCRREDHPPLEEKAPGHWVACYEV
ncbi:ABC transporter ATP-binding protein [Limnochorda pilosa]|uniref:Oligopeptide ABC transporter ATP-binding protein n=1 Tax=Limnochorda pilosa TaxID=1555112 RepID=A0A0K2SHI2_LIMPI|nr:oligopeptide ABC transporter ATP-binding protein [Limnochorda pilosa]